MAISDEIRAIRDKYTPKDLKLKPSHHCRNTYAFSLGECARCGQCGREFDENGNLIDIDDRPIFVQLEEVFNKKGQE